jgi:hypothetical protein
MHRTHDRLVTHTFLKQSCRFRNSNLHKPNDCLLCTQNIGSKNGNMVLQLVLPSNSNADNGTYLTSNSFEEILGESTKTRVRSNRDVHGRSYGLRDGQTGWTPRDVYLLAL